jgi:hypothetical protein
MITSYQQRMSENEDNEEEIEIEEEEKDVLMYISKILETIIA